MVDPDRRPTAQEIEELIDLVRRDPASPAFIDLGEAYLALGRPRDALQVGSIGLQAAPDSLAGRVLLARAYATLHQWKEAQGELLRVVKVDRSNRHGFALLGEVLLRRQDFERAVPVLQHAQNLDPTSPQILAMLRRARAGQPLDPPPPQPIPVPPRGETDNGQPIVRSRPGPTPGTRRTVPPPPPHSTAPPMVPVAAPAMPTLAIEPLHDWRNEPATEHMPPPSFAEASSPVAAGRSPAAPAFPAGPMSRGMKQAAPPPMSVEGVRPRLVQVDKPQNAAAASLRQSAAVGESYLNELLTGGLLDVAGVRVPDADFDLRPDRRWGRSTRRAFVFLFVVLVLGIGGGGTWYWWSEKQKAEAVARLQHESQVAISAGEYTGFEVCLKKLGEALEKDKNSLVSFAYVAECSGLEALLYGKEVDGIDQAVSRSKVIKDDEPGGRELLIGRAALELSRLSAGDSDAAATAAKSSLAEVRKSLDRYLDPRHAAERDKDKESKEKWRWMEWLRGRAALAAGERRAGRAMIKDAADGDDGLLVALIDTADLLVDDGQLDEAQVIYDKAAARAKDHPLIIVGRSIGRADASVQNEETIGDLSVKLPKDLPARLSSYRYLATALADLDIEAYVSAGDALHKATAQRPPNEPRFWARVASVQLARGDIAAANAIVATKIVWFGQGQTKPEDEPTAQLVKASLSLTFGRPDKALEVAGPLKGVRPALLRAYADLDLGNAKDARKEAEDALKTSPDNIEAKILREQARAIASDGKERSEAISALEKLASHAKSKLGRQALGAAQLAIGNLKEAQVQLEKATTEITDDTPNPMIYRSRTALAEVLLALGDVAGAGTQVDEALKVNAAYVPTRVVQAKTVLRDGRPEKALEYAKPLIAELGKPMPELQLVYAEALATTRDATAKDKAEAVDLVKALKDKVPVADLSRAAAAIDPKLPKEMGIPEPTAAGPDAAKPPCDKHKHRCS